MAVEWVKTDGSKRAVLNDTFEGTLATRYGVRETYGSTLSVLNGGFGYGRLGSMGCNLSWRMMRYERSVEHGVLETEC